MTPEPARSRLPLRVANPTPVQPTYRRLARFAGWLLNLLVDTDWDDAEHLPRSGGVILVSNHISNFDPPALAHYVVWHGRWPCGATPGVRGIRRLGRRRGARVGAA